MLNDECNALAGYPEVDFYPPSLRAEIEVWNDFIAERRNDGVCRCLLAKDQAQYEAEFDRLFSAFDVLDARLGERRYLMGAQPTEPDWRLFACLVRFDAVYYPLYQCNRQRIVDFPTCGTTPVISINCPTLR